MLCGGSSRAACSAMLVSTALLHPTLASVVGLLSVTLALVVVTQELARDAARARGRLVRILRTF